MTTITVLLPVYNAVQYLDEALRSLLGQSMNDFVILALDDGSTDGSLERLYLSTDPRLRVAPSTKNLGLGATLRRGLDLCDTEFFARMDADDRCTPIRLAKQLEFLHAHPEVGMVGTQFRYFGTSGKATISPQMPLEHGEIQRGLLEKRLSIVHGSILARTDVVKRVGGYRVQGMGEDWDMFLRMGESSKLANLPDMLYEWRLHSANADTTHLMEQQIGIEFACDCARRRSSRSPELTFPQFKREWEAQFWLTKWLKRLDVHALAQYRKALTAISNEHRLVGYSRLAYSAACAPARTLRRFYYGNSAQSIGADRKTRAE